MNRDELAPVIDFCKEHGFEYALSILDQEPKAPQRVCGTCRWCSGGYHKSCRYNPPTAGEGFAAVSLLSWCRMHEPIGIHEAVAKADEDAQEIIRLYGINPFACRLSRDDRYRWRVELNPEESEKP